MPLGVASPAIAGLTTAFSFADWSGSSVLLAAEIVVTDAGGPTVTVSGREVLVANVAEPL